MQVGLEGNLRNKNGKHGVRSRDDETAERTAGIGLAHMIESLRKSDGRRWADKERKGQAKTVMDQKGEEQQAVQ